MIGPLQLAMTKARIEELHRQAQEHRRPPRTTPPPIEHEPVTLRFGFPDDADALARLATLDSAEPLSGPVLLAEVAGELRAALSLSTGLVLADPFRPSVQAVELLHARARQLRTEQGPRGFRPLRMIRRLRPSARTTAL